MAQYKEPKEYPPNAPNNRAIPSGKQHSNLYPLQYNYYQWKDMETAENTGSAEKFNNTVFSIFSVSSVV